MRRSAEKGQMNCLGKGRRTPIAGLRVNCTVHLHAVRCLASPFLEDEALRITEKLLKNEIKRAREQLDAREKGNASMKC